MIMAFFQTFFLVGCFVLFLRRKNAGFYGITAFFFVFTKNSNDSKINYIIFVPQVPNGRCLDDVFALDLFACLEGSRGLARNAEEEGRRDCGVHDQNDSD